jgi:hypothetical protein
MLNFYRRFLPHAEATQAKLHDVLSGPRVNGSHPITSTSELLKAFDECKASLSRATLLTHPDPFAPLALVTDASTSAMGAVLQQRVKNAWQPLAFSKKLNPAQQKYSAYDRELLAIYEAVKHLRHMPEARYFTIFTDNKPITRLPADARQMLTAAVQPPRLRRPVNNGHTAYFRPGQRCRGRLLLR